MKGFHSPRRKSFSQNYIDKPSLIRELLEKSSINGEDLVLDIGAGKGNITSVLAETASKVIAVERDRNLYQSLKDKFTGNVEVVNGDFREFELPKTKYKVFANPPFIIISDIVRKLTADPNFEEGYLVMQREAAAKFVGKPMDSKNSMMAILLASQFEVSLFHEFQRFDFVPVPSIRIVMVHIKRSREVDSMYKNFVIYIYNQFEPSVFDSLKKLVGEDKARELERKVGKLHLKPSELSKDDWSVFANMFLDLKDTKAIQKVREGASKVLENQKKLTKIHKTRV